jgi:hypothetical protein
MTRKRQLSVFAESIRKILRRYPEERRRLEAGILQHIDLPKFI